MLTIFDLPEMPINDIVEEEEHDDNIEDVNEEYITTNDPDD